MARTQDEIKKQYEDRKEADFFGFEVEEYLPFLDFKTIQTMDVLKKDIKIEEAAKEWQKVYQEATDENIKKKMFDYMEFAWEKANNCRGISSNRSIDHYTAWLWLMNDGNLEKMEKVPYQHYGKEKLVFICEAYGWDYKQWDDNVRVNDDQ